MKFRGSVALELLIDNQKFIKNFNGILRDIMIPMQPEPFRYQKLSPEACTPNRARASESGFDLTLINIKKRIGEVILFGTGISVQPPTGYYFDMVPRSSIIKSGYMLANSVLLTKVTLEKLWFH